MAKIKIDKNLYTRVKDFSESEGYSSPEEFVTHIIEQELSKRKSADSDEKVQEQLRGLGYIE